MSQRYLRMILFVAFAWITIAAPAQLSHIIGSNITDAAGKKMAQGTVDFLPVSLSGVPIQPHIGGGGIALYKPAQCLISLGVVTTAADGTTCTLVDTSLADQKNFCYKALFKDTSVTPSNRLPEIKCIQPHGATWSFDTDYIPDAIPNTLKEAGPAGPQGPTGPTGATGCSTSSDPSVCFPGVRSDGANGLKVDGAVTSPTPWASLATGYNVTNDDTSIEYGLGLSGSTLATGGKATAWPNVLGTLSFFGGRASVYDSGIPGNTSEACTAFANGGANVVPGMLALYTTGSTYGGATVPSSHSLSPAQSGKPGYLFISGNVALNNAQCNTPTVLTVAQTIADLQSYVATARADGWLVVAVTAQSIFQPGACVYNGAADATDCNDFVQQINQALRRGEGLSDATAATLGVIPSDILIDASQAIQNGLDPILMQGDGVHPTEQGQRVIARYINKALIDYGGTSSASGGYHSAPAFFEQQVKVQGMFTALGQALFSGSTNGTNYPVMIYGTAGSSGAPMLRVKNSAAVGTAVSTRVDIADNTDALQLALYSHFAADTLNPSINEFYSPNLPVWIGVGTHTSQFQIGASSISLLPNTLHFGNGSYASSLINGVLNIAGSYQIAGAGVLLNSSGDTFLRSSGGATRMETGSTLLFSCNNVGLCGVGPQTTVSMDPFTVDTSGNIIMSGALTVGNGITGPATAPTGTCTSAGKWVFSQDGHATFCPSSGGSWTTKI